MLFELRDILSLTVYMVELIRKLWGGIDNKISELRKLYLLTYLMS